MKFIDPLDEVKGEAIIKYFEKQEKAAKLETIVSKLKYQKFIQGNYTESFAKKNYLI